MDNSSTSQHAMDETYQFSRDNAITDALTAGNLESSLSDHPKPGAKRPFHDPSAASQAHERQDTILEAEDGVVSPHRTYHAVPLPPISDIDSEESDEDARGGFHVEKRSRTSDWPLRNTTAIKEEPSIPRGSLRDRYSAMGSASPPRYSSVKPRPSKFLEGSMNDRTSQIPHASYTGDSEDAREQLETEQHYYDDARSKTQVDGFTHHPNRSTLQSTSNEKSDASRPSSIFRFGKSLAAAFNPSSWKIWSKQQEEETQEKTTLRERHEKAEKTYKELKRAGQLRGSTYGTRLDATNKSLPFPKHDSGVDMTYSSSRIDSAYQSGSSYVETKMEEKRYGRVYVDPPSIGSVSRGESLEPEQFVPPRKSFRDSTLSLAETANGPQALRRLPSRKDLQKQQKLVKKVSDLESKLETARRQLAEALGEPFPAQAVRINRSRFTPGTLASLPSERLLSAYTAPDTNPGDGGATVGVGMAMLINNSTKALIPNDSVHKPETTDPVNPILETPEALAIEHAVGGSDEVEQGCGVEQVELPEIPEDKQAEQVLDDTLPKITNDMALIRQTSRKRKSFDMNIDDEGGRKLTLDPDDDDDVEAAKPPAPRRGPGRSRKLQKVDPEPRVIQADSFEAMDIPRASIEAASPRSSHNQPARGPKGRRATVSKKAALSADNSPSSRKARYPVSPPPVSSSGTPYPAQDDGACESAISTIPSTDVPPIPNLTTSITGANKMVRKPLSAASASSHSKDDNNKSNNAKIKAETSNMESKKTKSTGGGGGGGAAASATKSKQQAFEWPEDVF